MLIASLQEQWTRVLSLDKEMAAIERRLTDSLRQTEHCKKLIKIPGVGLLTATAAVATISDAATFKSGREFAAWLGLVPRQTGTGGRVRQLGLSKRGDVYLRTLLMHGAVPSSHAVSFRHGQNSYCYDGLTAWSLPRWQTNSPAPFGPYYITGPPTNRGIVAAPTVSPRWQRSCNTPFKERKRDEHDGEQVGPGEDNLVGK